MKPIISKNIRVRCPDQFTVGDYSIVDDYSYFSTQVSIGRFTHFASGCTVGGGVDRKLTVGDFCGISAGTRIWCASDDYAEDLITVIPSGLVGIKTGIVGDVTLENYTGIGSNSVVMPGNRIPEGAAIGALSFVPTNFEMKPWFLYAGNPIRVVRARNRDRILEQARKVLEQIEANHASRSDT